MESRLSASRAILDQLETINDPARLLTVARELREAGDFDAADAVLSAAARRFTGIAGVHHERARLAEARGNWPQAEAAWRAFLAVDPRPWWAYTALANTLREQARIEEADEVLTAEIQRQPNEPALAVELARLAERCGDWARASELWEETVTRFPDRLEGYTGRARALRELNRLQDAEALLLRSAELFPNHAVPCHDIARLAEARRDWPAAERWWRAFIAIDARAWWAYTALANALLEQNRSAEGEAILASVLDELGHERPLFVEYARFAEREGAWVEAERRWCAVIARFPTAWDGYAGRAGALRSLGRLTDARDCLVSAIEQLPTSVPLWHQLARLHETMRDWAEAERCWRKSVELDDRIWWAHAGIANALRGQGDLVKAEAVLAPLLLRFPDEPAVIHELARLADTAGDQPKALDYWQRALARFPNDWPAHLGTATALIRSNGRADAKALLQTAQERFPQIAPFVVEGARLADADRDWSRSKVLWLEACTRFPRDLGIRIGQVNARREEGDLEAASEALAAALGDFPNQPELFHQKAFLHEMNDEWQKSSDAWIRAIELDPSSELSYIRGSFALFRAGKPSEASQLLERGCQSLGSRPAFLRELGLLAERQHNWQEAVEKYRKYTALHPGDIDPVCRLAMALAQTGKLTEGEVLLRTAIERYPDELRLHIDYAKIALRLGASGNQEFVDRARAIAERFPASAEAALLYVDSLSFCNDLATAEAVLRTSMEKLPKGIAITRRLAEILSRQGKWNDAIALYTLLVSDYPPHKDIWLGYIGALVGNQSFDQADTVAAEAIRRFPSEGRFYVAQLDLAIAIGKLDSAAVIWKEVAKKFTGSIEINRLLFERRNQLVGMGIMLANPDTVPDSVHPEEEKIENIVTRFESLGGYGIGCEFGQFQRLYGAEPLGLLRWTEIKADQLADALEARFNGVGHPEQTRLDAGQAVDSEYSAWDRRFGMRMHTFVPTHSVPYDKMFAQMCRRMSFLANKLIEDLRAGEKIFVYKNAVNNITDQEIERLHRAIRSYGNTTLFCLRRADKDHPFPSLLCPEPGLMIGYLDRFELLEDGSTGSVPALSWATIVMAAYRMARSGSQV